MKGILLVAVVAAAFPAIALPGVYKCLDESGNVTFSQVQCPDAESVEKVRIDAPPKKEPMVGVPVQTELGEMVLVPVDQVAPGTDSGSDYYSVQNQLERMKAAREAEFAKKRAAERQATIDRRARELHQRQVGSDSEVDEKKCELYKAYADKYRLQSYSTDEEKRQNELKYRQWDLHAARVCR